MGIWLTLCYTYSIGGNVVYCVSLARSRVTQIYFSLTVTLLLLYSPYIHLMIWHIYTLSLLVLLITSQLERLEITGYVACLTTWSGEAALQDKCAGQWFWRRKYDFEWRRHKYIHVCMYVCMYHITNTDKHSTLFY